jgi:hypothetical protein
VTFGSLVTTATYRPVVLVCDDEDADKRVCSIAGMMVGRGKLKYLEKHLS